MSDYDDELAALLADSVSDVEPTDALDTLRTRTKVTPMSSRRPWLLATGGAVVATAAVITAIALAGGAGPAAQDPSPTPGPATQQPSEPTSPEITTDFEGEATTLVPVYFAGDTPEGVRLYREFEAVADPRPTLLEATDRAVSGTPDDGDYRTLWPSGSVVADATWDGDVARIDLSGAPADVPTGMSDDEARLAIQQVVYTAQAAIGEGRVPVQLTVEGQPTAQILGQPTSEPLTNGPVLETLAHVSLTEPSEGATISGDTLDVSGVANSFEANVVVRLQRWEGTEIVFESYASAEGWMAEKLFPFEASLDISDVPPGDYLLIAMTDDPSGGAEGGGSHTDSKRITVE